MCDMHKLVIGSVSFSRLSDLEISGILDKAQELGINEIDTAPIYGDAQINLGRNLPQIGWKINSKVLSPEHISVDPKEIERTVDNSLKELGIEQINTLFIHSIPYEAYNSKIHEELLKLKNKGKVSKIGYSGDGRSLNLFSSNYQFDAFQATLNVLDLTNLDFFRKNDRMQGYIKRPLCNQVFKLKLKLELSERFHQMLHGSTKDMQSYVERYKKIFGNRLFSHGNPEFILNFLFSLNLNANTVIGLSSKKHLIEIVNFRDSFKALDAFQLESYISKWKIYAAENHWEPLV